MPERNVPICVKCGKTMRCEKSGQRSAWRSMNPRVGSVFSSDRYACRTCPAEVLIGNSDYFREPGLRDDEVLILKGE